ILSKNSARFALGAYDRSRPLVIDPVLSYSTYLGGSATDAAYGIAVSGNGFAYVTGSTASVDFPITAGAYQTACSACADAEQSSDAFITKLNQSGSGLVYSTYLGRGRRGQRVA